MVTVNGMTAERMVEIEAASIVSAAIDEDEDKLLFTRHDGSQVDAGLLALQPIPVPQLVNLPVRIYGHSLTTPAGGVWHTQGTHWTNRLGLAEPKPESVTVCGVGGSKIEETTLLFTGAGGTAWPQNSTVKRVMLCMAMVNSNGPNAPGATLTDSVNSIKVAAHHLIVASLTTRYDFTDPSWTQSVGAGVGWSVQTLSSGAPSVTYPAGAFLWTANDPAWAQFTVPAGITNRHVWLEMLVFPPATAQASIQIQKNSVVGYNAAMGTTDLPSGFSKKMFYAGQCSTGDVIRLDKVGSAGLVYLTGAYVAHDRNHVVMIGDHDNNENPAVPYTANMQAHNLGLSQIVSDMVPLFPNGVSFINLADNQRHTPDMLWSGDGAHPNDKGQAWYYRTISRMLKNTIPWTTRIHTI